MLVASAILLALTLGLAVLVALALVWATREMSEIRATVERREERWATERERLLDRVQAPHLATAHLIPQGEGSQGPTDEEVDERFARHPASTVPWDEDLLPLTPPEQDAVGG